MAYSSYARMDTRINHLEKSPTQILTALKAQDGQQACQTYHGADLLLAVTYNGYAIDQVVLEFVYILS